MFLDPENKAKRNKKDGSMKEKHLKDSCVFKTERRIKQRENHQW